MAFLDVILLAVLAVFLGYRLWLVLGTYDKDKPLRKRRSQEDDVVVSVRAKAAASATESSAPREEASQKPMEDDRFLQGAVLAFHEIVESYAMGDFSTLQKLLEGPLLETFEEAINKRKKAKKVLEVDIARIVTSEILDKREEKGVSYITVKFVSEQCLVTRNGKGKVLEGDPDRYSEVTDIWTFSRPFASSGPNWKLVATQVPEV
ncbi:MAG: Tim44 domain-containing protein [Alphaproteobacteria bacterium]|jgi:predicted lipid-binding transport protein (Tim44 family)|nr:Tim44 domain-containing protein [Alphaproteobacteria bacterium]MBP7729132.1 Tim44 domain-containing protein [Alphaproteobacteria bacterium]